MSQLDAKWLQNVKSKNVDTSKLQPEVVYTTAVCVESNDLNVLLIYNNDTTNITVTAIKSYVANTTDSFILSSIQSGATVYYTLQVIDIDRNTVGSASTGSFVFMSSPPSMTPTSAVSSMLYLCYCNMY